MDVFCFVCVIDGDTEAYPKRVYLFRGSSYCAEHLIAQYNLAKVKEVI